MPTSSQKSKKRTPPEYAYSISNLPGGYVLKVRKSANAWWMDETRVQLLIIAFNMGVSIRLACAFVRITIRQYKYFVRLHPEIREIRDACEAMIELAALKNIAKAIEENTNIKDSWKYLAYKYPKEWGKHGKSRSQRENSEEEKSWTYEEIEEMNRKEAEEEERRRNKN